MSDKATITKEQIEQFKTQRVKECGEALAALLKEYDCDLCAVPQIIEGRIVAVVELRAN